MDTTEFDEKNLGFEHFEIEDLKLLIGVVGVLKSRLNYPCYRQDFTISHILQKAAKDLIGASEMMALRIMGDLQNE